jgi:uncharacterized protein YaiE (UPF0345 family)
MNKDEAIDMLCRAAPSASVLRKEYSELSDLLQGEFFGSDVEEPKPQFNVYPFPNDGLVVSRRLFQGLEKDPTVGLIFPGDYEFPTGKYTEIMKVLCGRLLAGKNDEPLSIIERGQKIEAPAGSVLKLKVERTLVHGGAVLYLCQYKPQ